MGKGFPEVKRFVLANPKKYLGDASNILLRSNLERKYAFFLDTSPQIVKWASEEKFMCIKYYITVLNPQTNKYELIDKKPHTYYPDFYVETIQGKKYLVEIKPHSQTSKPRNSKTKSQRVLLNEHLTYAKNDSKWRAAKAVCDNDGISFIVLTEKDIK